MCDEASNTSERADEFCSILVRSNILPPEKPTNIGYQRKKAATQLSATYTVMQAAEARTGDHRGACRRSTFHWTSIRSILSSES